MNIKSSHFILLLIAAAGTMPFAARAAVFTITHDGGATAVIGTPFEVSIALDTQNIDINAIQADITFPADSLSLQTILDGSSPISLWIEPPKEISSGTVEFSGIIPGGIAGATNPIVTLVLMPTREGDAKITVQNAKVLENDGHGTLVPATSTTDSIAIVTGTGSGNGIQGVVLPHSTPATFSPTIESDPNVYDGRLFLVFGTTDKGSGMNYYEVAEVPAGTSIEANTQWTVATSPYLLSDQSQGSDIYVRAVNNAGNSTVAKLSAKHPESSRNWAFEEFAVIAVGIFLLLFFVIRRNLRGKKLI